MTIAARRLHSQRAVRAVVPESRARAAILTIMKVPVKAPVLAGIPETAVWKRTISSIAKLCVAQPEDRLRKAGDDLASELRSQKLGYATCSSFPCGERSNDHDRAAHR